MRLARILRDYDDAGSLNGLLAVWGFVDDYTFITKAGHVGCALTVSGVDAEGLTHSERASLTHRVEAALRLLDEQFILYQYVIKRVIAPLETPSCRRPVGQVALQHRTDYLNARRQDLYRADHFLVLLHEGDAQGDTSTRLRNLCASPREALRRWLSTSRTLAVMSDALDESVTRLHQRADAVIVQLDAFGLRKMAKSETFAFLRRLVNVDDEVAATAALAYDTHIDYFLTDSTIECHKDHLTVGTRGVRVLSMKEPPCHTFANLSAQLLDIPGELTACLEWRRISNDRARRDIKTRQRHFFNRRVSLINYVGPEVKSDDMLVDLSASAIVTQHGDALTEIEVNGRTFGSCSLTLALIGADQTRLRTQTSEAAKVLAANDGAFFEETYNALNAWLAMVPGNTAYNLRRLVLLDTNLADMSFFCSNDAGHQVCPHPNRPALATFETVHHTTFAFNLHVQDVGHTLVLGATGSGKSFLLNFLVTHAQQYDPLTVVLDLGHSYRRLTDLLEGRYLELGLKRGNVQINPFAFEPTREHLHFLHAFVRVLLEGEDGYRLSEREDRELYDAIENLYVLDRGQRRLFTLANLLPRYLALRLHKWIEGGRYAALFDNDEDTLSIDSLQVFDFEAMRAYPSLLEPLLFYVLQRVTQRVQDQADTGLKLCVMDEAWRFIQHPVLRAYVQEGLKTWRKRHAAMVLATQTIDDFASADLLRTVVESCPTKLLLANPSFDANRYAELFQLNAMELDLVAKLVPRQQFLLKRPGLAKVLALNVDAKSQWIYSNAQGSDDRTKPLTLVWDADTLPTPVGVVM